MRKRTRKPDSAKILKLVESLVDFVESLPTQSSPTEGFRQAVLTAADKAGYKHKIQR